MNNLNFKNFDLSNINSAHTSNCRRYQLDRRVTDLNIMKKLFYCGERRQHRRYSDKQDFKYFDRYEPHLLLISVLVILFSLFDAFLTLKIIAGGGVELNYFANLLIGLGLYGFIFSKYLITAIGMIILVLHKHYQVFLGLQVRHIIYSIVFIYTVLIFYELIIISLV